MKNIGKWYVINGVKQYVQFISENVEDPVLIYLHGGPGDAALPLVEHFNKELAQKYTLVIWEQRGSGKSYYPFAKNERMTINTFVSDLKILIDHLLTEWEKDNVCLMGHSWGSIIGLEFIKQYPELVDYYIGVGQVVCSQRMFEDSRTYILNQPVRPKIKQQISAIDTSFNQKNWYTDLMFFMNQLIKTKGSLYNQKTYISFYNYFIRSKNYSLMDCINRLKGSKQSIERLWQEVATIDFTKDTKFEVPVILIEGEYDYHASNELAFDFYQAIESPKAYICMKNTAHFPQWSRAETFNQVVNTLEIPIKSGENYLVV